MSSKVCVTMRRGGVIKKRKQNQKTKTVSVSLIHELNIDTFDEAMAIEALVCMNVLVSFEDSETSSCDSSGSCASC